jgi:hypothetical protein
MKKVGIPILLAAIVFLHTHCNNSSMVLKVTLEGYVYDSLGGKPVNGTWVYLYGCSYDDKDQQQYTPFIIGQAQTDVSGRFYIHDNAARSNRYGLTINNHIIKGSFGFGTNNNWLKANCAKIYLNKL